MDERKTYQVYVSIMKLHKKYAAEQPCKSRLPDFIKDINVLNSAFSSNFCNVMTDALRQWFIMDFQGLSDSEISGFYTDLWRFHKKYMKLAHDDVFWREVMDETEQLNKKYPFRQYQWFALAIVDELETNGQHKLIETMDGEPEKDA